MNFSIYIKLRIANAFGKVKIREKYKHLEYMIEKNYIEPINDKWVDIGEWSLPTHSNRYTITSDGKDAMWNEKKHITTRIIAWIAVFISVSSFAFSLFTYLKK